MKKVVYQNDGSVSLIDPDHEILDAPKPGYLKVKSTRSFFGTSYSIETDEYVSIPKSALAISKEYINVGELEDYFSETSRKIHQGLGVKMKLSFMLYGKQGTGKTTASYAVIDFFIRNYNMVCVTVTDMNEFTFAVEFLKQAKGKEGAFLSAIVFDECEKDMYHNENQMKRILDSSDSIDNHMFFFTTNYVENIPDTILNRPSRIKYPIEFTGVKEEESVYQILQHMNSVLDKDVKLTDAELKYVVPELKGKTLDEIKHAFVDHVYKLNMANKNVKNLTTA